MPLKMAPLLNKYYGNEVILRGQKTPLKSCQPLDFWYKDASFVLNEYQNHVRQLNFEFSRKNRDCEN